MITNSAYYPSAPEHTHIVGFLNYLEAEGFIVRKDNAYHINSLTVIVERDDHHGMIGVVGEVPR